MDNIKVAIRVRPLIAREQHHGLTSNWIVKDDSISPLDKNGRLGSSAYTFDRVFDEGTTTYDIFEDICKPIIGSAVTGFHGTIFAYGQSSSGKTFTMSGTRMSPGIISLSVEEIFDIIENTEDREFLLRVSYMELYNEKVTDLLAKASEEQPLPIFENTDGYIEVRGLKEEIVKSTSDVFNVMKIGDARKNMAETKQNDRSSRSHCIIRMIIESRKVDDDGAVMVSHLNFVDLAGSEKAGENTGDRFREGCHINLSLLYLSQVIKKLSEGVGRNHINYRDSKLTRILQNALGGNSKTAIICAITPAIVEESHSTLRFASTAKTISNKPQVNECLSDAALLKKYKSELTRLKKLVDEKGLAVTQSEKEDLQKKLTEKEAAQRQQEELIVKLKQIIITSSSTDHTSNSIPIKRRRLTWCPGNSARRQRSLAHERLPMGLPMIQDISPPKESFEDADSAFSINSSLQCIPPAKRKSSLQANSSRRSYFSDVSVGFSPDPQTKQLMELQDKHENLMNDHSKLKSDMKEMNMYHELERKTLEDTVQELTEQMQMYQTSLPEIELQCQKSETEKAELKEQVDSLRGQLDELKSHPLLKIDPEGDMAEMAAQFKVIKNGFDEEQAKFLKQCENFEMEISELKNVNSHLIDQQSEQKGEYENKIKEMTEASEILNKTVEELKVDLKKIKEERDTMSDEVFQLQHKFQIQSSKLTDCQNVLTNMREENSDGGSGPSDSSGAAKEECDKQIAILKEQNEVLSSEISDLKNINEELTHRQTMSEEMYEQKLKDTQEKADLYESTVTDFREEMQNSESEKETLREEVNRLQQEMDKLRQEMSDLVSTDHVKEIEAKTSDIKQDYEKQISAIQSEHELQKQDMLSEISNLNKKLTDVVEISKEKDETSSLDLKEELENKMKNMEEKHIEEKGSLETEISNLRCRVDDLQNCQKENELNTEKVRQAENEISDLKSKHGEEMELHRSEFEKLQNQMTCLQDKLLDLEKEKSDLSQELEIIRQEEVKIEENSREKHSQEVEDIKKDCEEKLQQFLQDMNTLKDDYENRIQTLISKYDQQKDHLQSEIIALKSRIETLSNERDEGDIDPTDVLDVKLETEAILNSKREQHQLEIKSIKEDCEKTVENLNTEISQLKMEVSELKGQTSYLVDPEQLHTEFQSIAETMKLEKEEEIEALKEDFELQKQCMQLDVTRLQEQLNDAQSGTRSTTPTEEFDEVKAEYEKFIEEMNKEREDEKQEFFNKIADLEHQLEESKKLDVHKIEIEKEKYDECLTNKTQLEMEMSEKETENKEECKDESFTSEVQADTAQKIDLIRSEYEGKLEKLSSECARLKSETENLKTRNQGLPDTVFDVSVSQSDIQELNYLRSECESLKEKIVHLENVNQEMTKVSMNDVHESDSHKAEEFQKEVFLLKDELENLQKINEQLMEQKNQSDLLQITNEEVSSLNQQISELQEKITELEINNEILQGKLTNAEQGENRDALEEQSESRDAFEEQTESRNVIEEVQDLKQEIQDLQSKNTQLMEEKTESDENLELFIMECENLKENLEKLECENNEMKEKIRLGTEFVYKLKQENQELQEKNCVGNKSVDENGDSEINELKETCAYLEKEVERLKSDSGDPETQGQLQVFKQQNEDMKSKLESLEGENQELKNQQETSKTNLMEVEQKVQMYEETINEFKDELKKAGEENSALQLQIDTLKKELTDTEDKLSHLHGDETVNLQVQGHLGNAKSEYEAVLSERLKEIERLNCDINELKQKDNSSEEKLKDASEKIELHAKAIEEFKVECKTLENEKSVLETKVNELMNEIKDNVLKLSHLHGDETVNLQVQSHVGDVKAGYEAELVNKSQEIEKLNKEIDDLKEKQENQENKCSESLEKLQVYGEVIQEFKENLKDAESKNDQLNDKISFLENELKENELKLSNLHGDETVNLQVQSNVSDVELRYKVMLDEQSQNILKLNSEIEDLKEKQSSHENRRQEAEEKLQVYEEVIQEFKENLKDAENKNDQLNDKISFLENELKENELKLSNLHSDETVNLQVQSNVSDVESKYKLIFDEQSQNILKLNSEIEDLKEKQNSHENQRQEAEEKIQMYEEAFQEFKGDLKKSEKENYTLQSKVEKLENELKEHEYKLGCLHGDETVNLQVQSNVDNVKSMYETELTQKRQEIEMLNSQINELKESSVSLMNQSKVSEKDQEQWKKQYREKEAFRIVEIKSLKIEVQNLKELISKYEIMIEQEKQREVESETYQKLQESEKEADDLYNKLEAEKSKTEQLEKKLGDVEKQDVKLKKKFCEVYNKSAQTEKTLKALEKEFADKNLDIYHLKRSIEKMEDQHSKKIKQYQETIEMQEERISQLKGEFRRCRDNDDTFIAPKEQQPSASEQRFVGISGAGGAVDHFANVLLKGDKERLQLKVTKLENENAELKKKITSVSNRTSSISNDEKTSELSNKIKELEKENLHLKKQVEEIRIEKSKPLHDLNTTATPRNDNSDSLWKLLDSSRKQESVTYDDSMWKVPQFKIPDLKKEKSETPKAPKADNCKQQ